ncbi:T-lymphocyte activation antigen CD86 isoform X1 [Diceros bicornis minor]|uniref:T-lymphocyte activation antigen CD86 isoform X1 n=2 Tax=Diceros bicornis minor TaxID=77932 RepID=UPI0026ED941D|nr:T-lymphocyte activation antigen CD86 isoform X1 [Diceros bicornis minor]
MGICDSTMGLSNTLFVMAFLLSGAASIKSQAYFNETGHLPCHFPNSQNISLDELVLFWQNQDKMVLYELYLGKENPDNVHAEYKGRTSFDQDSWTLRLHNVQIKDKGLYQCFIHHKGPKGLVPAYQMSSELSVLANFSQPEILLISNRTENSDIINLTCSSTQGYPEPKKMYFLLETENSTTKYDAVMNKSQNNVTELYNVSISLSFSVPSETNNVSIFCVLQPEPMETELLSPPYNIGAKPRETPLPDKDHTVWIAGLLLTLVIVCVMLLFLTRRKWKKKQPGRSRECETMRVEEKESEQTEERVENREISDEARRVVNISKTASGD